jgi:hypothetical protein
VPGAPVKAVLEHQRRDLADEQVLPPQPVLEPA